MGRRMAALFSPAAEPVKDPLTSPAEGGMKEQRTLNSFFAKKPKPQPARPTGAAAVSE